MNTINGIDFLLMVLCFVSYWLGYMRAKHVAQKIRDAEMDLYYQEYLKEHEGYVTRGSND